MNGVCSPVPTGDMLHAAYHGGIRKVFEHCLLQPLPVPSNVPSPDADNGLQPATAWQYMDGATS